MYKNIYKIYIVGMQQKQKNFRGKKPYDRNIRKEVENYLDSINYGGSRTYEIMKIFNSYENSCSNKQRCYIIIT